jgi:hypothetical protein
VGRKLKQMNIRVGDKVSKIKRARLLIRGFIRCRIWSFCPKCNSDAPEKDTCSVCENFYGYPGKLLRLFWWFKFKDYIKNKS